MELFIGNERDGYYHLAFNCYANGENGIYDALGTNSSWSTKWTAYSKITKGEWRGVAVIPGLAFGDDDSIRLAYTVSCDDIEKGVRGIERFISELV